MKRMTLVREHVELAPLTTMRLGGPARYFAECKTNDDVTSALAFGREHGLPVHILGGGSNSIFLDEGFSGLVLAVRMRGVTFQADGVIEAAAGEPWDPLVAKTISRGLAGFECLSGIPGLVGATPIQNVGAYGQEVAEVIETVTVIDRADGHERTLSNTECNFTYRTSRFKQADAGKYIITSVRYRLRPDGVPTLRYPQLREVLGAEGALESGMSGLAAVREAVLELRRAKSMVIDDADPNTRSCGSFFVNPVVPKAQAEKLQQQYSDMPTFTGEETPHGTAAAGWTGSHIKIPAAWLIERAGFMKGLQRGGVGISSRHPLALVNKSGTTKELLSLAADIHTAVHEQFSIELEQEPVVVPPGSAVQ